LTTRRSNGNGTTRTSNGGLSTTRRSNGNGTTAANGSRRKSNGNGNGAFSTTNGNGGFTTTIRRPSNGYLTESALETDIAPPPDSTTATPHTAYTSEEPIEDAMPAADEAASDALLGDDQESAVDDEIVGEEQAADDEQAAPSMELPADEDPAHVSGGGKRKGPLEYDLEYMYPEIDLLCKSKRKDWNYNDPETIRAIWLEAKTHALADWKQKYVKIKRSKDVKIHDNQANQLRNEFRKMKQEREQIEEASLVIGRDAPVYHELTLPTTVTAQMRYKLNRDDPPIPDSFIFHYAKFKKPPFIRSTMTSERCREAHIGN
jgi:hypothetical protein